MDIPSPSTDTFTHRQDSSSPSSTSSPSQTIQLDFNAVSIAHSPQNNSSDILAQFDQYITTPQLSASLPSNTPQSATVTDISLQQQQQQQQQQHQDKSTGNHKKKHKKDKKKSSNKSNTTDTFITSSSTTTTATAAAAAATNEVLSSVDSDTNSLLSLDVRSQSSSDEEQEIDSVDKPLIDHRSKHGNLPQNSLKTNFFTPSPNNHFLETDHSHSTTQNTHTALLHSTKKGTHIPLKPLTVANQAKATHNTTTSHTFTSTPSTSNHTLQTSDLFGEETSEDSISASSPPSLVVSPDLSLSSRSLSFPASPSASILPSDMVYKTSRPASSSSSLLVLNSFLLVVWFISSILSTLINKTLMDIFPYAVTLSAVHMSSSVIVDFIIMYYRQLPFTFRKDILISSLPVATTINFCKVLTYVSYGMVPASLTHTAKASSPVFSVILSKVLFNQVPSLHTFLSLIPITIGVILSAVTEINFSLIGFISAVAAAFANVLNSIYTKKALSHVNCTDPIIFHMYTASSAVLMLLPYVLFVDGRDFFNTATKSLPSVPTSSLEIEAVDAIGPRDAVFPWRLILISVTLHYAQNISSIYFLNSVSVLTHQVAQSMKRLTVITSTVLYFGNPVTALNVLGMLLALSGFSIYSYAKSLKGSQRKQHSGTNPATNTPTANPPSPSHVPLTSTSSLGVSNTSSFVARHTHTTNPTAGNVPSPILSATPGSSNLVSININGNDDESNHGHKEKSSNTLELV